MPKKILILYTSVGLGHQTIAENIGWHLERAGFEVKLADIGKVQKGKFEKVVVGCHQFINQYIPFVWGWLYNWGHYIILPFRVFIAGFNCQLTKGYVDEFQPDIIITTQTAASAVIAYLKKKNLYKGSFGIAFSDFHLHRYWLYKQADFYLANIAEQKQQMIKLGVPQHEIFVCGITLKPRADVNAGEAKKKFNIGQGDKVALVASGSLGTGLDAGLIGRLAGQPNIKIIVVCGKNRAAFQKLQKLFSHTGKVSVLGFYAQMDELYAIADIFISKPGGLSVAEALRFKLPILITHLLPGQEAYNYKYLLYRQLVMPEAPDAVAAALAELRSGAFKKFLGGNRAADELLGDQNGLEKAMAFALK